jgi:diguanylate cyclase (GGDEF)-like protein
MVTAKGSTEHIARGLDAGADDYLVKPVDPEELRARLKAGQRILDLHSDLLAAKRDLLRQSRTDSLTGVLNRRAILSELRGELNRVRRGKGPLSLCLFDIDDFKRLNDTFGHPAGDEGLKECVSRVQAVIRSYDSLGRIGGDEFLVLLPGTGEAEALGICHRIQKVICDEPLKLKKGTFDLTVSLGLVTSAGNEEPEKLLEAVDRAMYQSKKEGGNRLNS